MTARLGIVGHAPTTLEGVSERHRAWTRSIFARLPDRAARSLLDTAIERELSPGTVAYREHPSQAMLALVVSGVLRVYVASPEGREVTVRYPRIGDPIGLTSVIAGGSPGRLEALTQARLLSFQVDVLRHLMKKDPAVACVIAEALTGLLFEVQGMLVDNVFGSVRARVAQHLIDLAMRDDYGVLRVHIAQQAIADAIGSVREVVSRVLAALREQGIIARDHNGIVLLDADALSDIAHRPRIEPAAA